MPPVLCSWFIDEKIISLVRIYLVSSSRDRKSRGERKKFHMKPFHNGTQSVCWWSVIFHQKTKHQIFIRRSRASGPKTSRTREGGVSNWQIARRTWQMVLLAIGNVSDVIFDRYWQLHAWNVRQVLNDACTCHMCQVYYVTDMWHLLSNAKCIYLRYWSGLHSYI